MVAYHERVRDFDFCSFVVTDVAERDRVPLVRRVAVFIRVQRLLGHFERFVNKVFFLVAGDVRGL